MAFLIVSVSAVLLLAVAVVVLCRWAGLKPWHALVCMLFGFYLASSNLAPALTHLGNRAGPNRGGPMTTNNPQPVYRRMPGENWRCRTLNENEATTGNTKEVTPSRDQSILDTAGIRTRYRALASGTDPAGPVLAMLREVPALCAEVDRLARLLVQARRGYANLAAAARAALSARAEGEPDPWWYLRDELGPDPVLPADPVLLPDPATGNGGCCL